jgi:hypothetical protein
MPGPIEETELELEKWDKRIWAGLVRRMPWLDNFAVVVALIIADILLFGVIGDDRGWRIIVLVLESLTLLVALHVSRVRTRTNVLALLLVAVFAVGGIAIAVDHVVRGNQPYSPILDAVVFLTGALLLGLPVLAIGRRLLAEIREEGVSLNTVFGALSIYLLIGAVYGLVYGLANALDQQIWHVSFFAQNVQVVVGDFVYFSFITLTTVGYGDLTALGQLGRMIAVSEALFGQLYLVTVVAVLVSNLGARERRAEMAEALKRAHDAGKRGEDEPAAEA